MKAIYTVTLNPAFDLHYRMAHFEAQKENYVDSILCDAGGKGINISRALKVNGTDSTAFVILGDENGEAFDRSFDGGDGEPPVGRGARQTFALGVFGFALCVARIVFHVAYDLHQYRQ